jgi:hypothetical protein
MGWELHAIATFAGHRSTESTLTYIHLSGRDLAGVRGAEKNRVEKLLEDAQIKLSVVASDIFGVPGRDMMAALLAGEPLLGSWSRQPRRSTVTAWPGQSRA